MFRRNLCLFLLALGLISFVPAVAYADDAPADAPKVEEKVEEKTKATPAEELSYTINTLIMFICAVLVIFMQAGFALVEVGLSSSKNAVNILSKNMMDLCIGILLFFFIGFGMMYPGGDAAKSSPWFSFGDRGVMGFGMEASTNVDATSDYSPNADFLFQVAFAATAATIVSGAVAGRIKFGAYLVYSAALCGFIYPVSGMWKWGYGALDQWGFQDFAGSVVVHAVGGFAALAGAIVLGARKGRFVNGKSVPLPGHNLVFAALGVFILWIGWYGFNPGSQLTYNGSANANATVFIAVTTTLSAAAGAVAAMIMSWGLFKKPDLTMMLNGALAGLVGITANCDQVPFWAALVIGAISGVLVVLGIILLDKLRIDDPVGAFPVHGICGVWGGIATGIFGTRLSWEPGSGTATVVYTRMEYIMVQLKCTAIICVWAFVTMFIVFMILKAFGMLRVSEADEAAGLDISEHGMHAYPAQLVVD